MEAKQTITKAYCNLMAIEKGLHPAGYGGTFDDAILIEMPLPWRRDLFMEANPAPQQMIDLMALWMERYKATGHYGHRPQVIAPDKAYSRAGFRRVMFYTRQQAEIAAFDKVEYSIPEAQLGDLLWAIYEAPDRLSAFDAYRDHAAERIRDLLVCTHGTVDAACAKFGYPLYNRLRQQYAHDHLRVWRVSHFGGHVFAPTLLDMPTGHYWAFVEDAQAQQIAQLDGDVRQLSGHYRGWAGLEPGFLQAAEYALWQRHGWAWFDYRKSGEIIAQDEGETPRWAQVVIRYIASDGTPGVCELRVEVQHQIETPPSTGKDKISTYPQYVAHII